MQIIVMQNILRYICLLIKPLATDVGKKIKKLTILFGGSENLFYFCPLERWQSGRLRRS